MSADSEVAQVLACYPKSCQPSRLESLGAAGGFSGARFWRLTTPSGLLCLRRWPTEHPSSERLEFIQAVLWHVHQEGFQRAPLPLETDRHTGYVSHGGFFWELAPWMPGLADFHERPTNPRLTAAMTALAQFHLAAASFPLPTLGPAPSPGILERRQQLETLLAGELARLTDAVRPGVWTEMEAPARRLLDLFPRVARQVLPELHRAADERVPLQPCIRDVWHDHVLFEQDQVTALIDFGAMRSENVAADVARLLGSLIEYDPKGWQAGLDAYQRFRPLSNSERALVQVFDRSGVLLSGVHWLRWVFAEGRQFENGHTILKRLETNLRRLAVLC